MTVNVDPLHLSICSYSHLPVTLSFSLLLSQPCQALQRIAVGVPPLWRHTCSLAFRASELSEFDFPDDTSYMHLRLSSNFCRSRARCLHEGAYFSIRAQQFSVFFQSFTFIHKQKSSTTTCQAKKKNKLLALDVSVLMLDCKTPGLSQKQVSPTQPT